MKCTIYRSNKKDLTYLYLPEQEDMEEALAKVPEALMKLIKPLEQVMEIELSPERTLAQEDVESVMQQLKEQGWFLQMPKDDNPAYNA